MRARFSAFAKRDAAFLIRTSHPSARRSLSPKDFSSSFALRWVGLTVTETLDGGPDDSTGVVAFEARYQDPDGNDGVLAERSRFTRDRDGAWVYVDGVIAG